MATRARAPLLLLVLMALPAASSAPGPARLAEDAAAALLGSMTSKQRAQALHPFNDPERFDLRLAPIGLQGLKMEDMTAAQVEDLDALLGAVLSPSGLEAVHAVRGQEDVVRAQERRRGMWVRQTLRGAGRYHLSLFGEPAEDEAWGLRFDGHHVSINATFVAGAQPSVSPFFLGSQPRVVPEGFPQAGLQVLQAEEDIARALLASLDIHQRALAVRPLELRRGLFSGDAPRIAPGALEGLDRQGMNPAQQAMLDGLVDVYLGRLAEPIAEERKKRLDRDSFVFAWAGSEQPGEPAWYRVQGADFLLEFDNSLPDADHIHSIWRDFNGDFGLDLLAEHQAREHTL